MENYKFIEKIGRGTHGTAYLLKSYLDNKLVVCKSISSKYAKHANREINILKRCKHKRVIRMIDFIKVSDSMYIILEYANCGTLDSMIKYYVKSAKKPPTGLVWSAISQISDALYYLHSNSIIHRDIKPANILICKTTYEKTDYLEFKLCDFSLSTETKDKIENRLIVGTPYYMAPEIIEKKHMITK
ncbi:SEPA [Hepatospora eriocheir]|uniref:SEPA n=1 Tax=Hepatospora eriocheir TaxID=1081669 RepID=A0A1X0Q962_9MICR|nr:SEPA [Hepatospora eriocheir]